MTTGEELYTLPNQVRTVLGVAFSPEGERLVTGGGETTRIWDVATGEEVITLSDVGENSVALSADGKRLFAGGFQDGVVRVFVLPLDEAIFYTVGSICNDKKNIVSSEEYKKINLFLAEETGSLGFQRSGLMIISEHIKKYFGRSNVNYYIDFSGIPEQIRYKSSLLDFICVTRWDIELFSRAYSSV